MTGPRIGGLFFGYGGLDMAVQSVLGGELAWVSEIDKGACKVIAHRYPGVPNIGDITAVDWSQVEPVDVLTGGSPCQDLSHAGKRAGMTEGTRSNLWVAMREAIAVLRPSLVVWENVRGAYSAEATSGLELDPRLLAGVRRRGGEPVLRALGRVLGDLSDLGYDAQWHGLRAADVGAPHGRFRVFVAATDARHGAGHREWARTESWEGSADAAWRGEGLGAELTLLSTPVADNSRGLPQPGTDYQSLPNAVCALLPTPAVNDMGEGKTVEDWDAWTDRMKAKHGNGNGHGASLSIEAQRLLPTPNAIDAGGGPNQRGSSGDLMLPSAVHALLPTPTTMDHKASGGNPNTTGTHGTTLTDATVRQPDRWGQYADAIHRWEQALYAHDRMAEQLLIPGYIPVGRPAPDPTETGPKGSPRLSARFSEWMMGLPDGWITDVSGITRNEALKLAGNGVVPQQAAAALRLMAYRAAVMAS